MKKQSRSDDEIKYQLTVMKEGTFNYMRSYLSMLTLEGFDDLRGEL
jgi:hypothetical protein